nr:helix-turn-helix transcriptional regulator [Ktedonobacteraceae bacterium]
MKDNTDEPPAMSEVDISRVGALLADSARAAMLVALRGDRAFSAGELAQCAGISASTASIHLTRLTDAGWVTVEQCGRHRYYRLASPRVAKLLEQSMSVASLCTASHPITGRERHEQPQHHELRLARTCYDHLAGELGVALTDALVRNGVVELADKDYTLTARGKALLVGWGVDVAAALGQRRAFARRCLDWTERRDHLGGALGATICSTWLAHGWVQRHEHGRALLITQQGMEQLQVWDAALPSL